MKLDLTGIGDIFLSEFEQLNSKKFKLAVIFAMLSLKQCKMHAITKNVLKLFEKNKVKKALFQVKIDEAINSLIANRVLIRCGKTYDALTLADDFQTTFNKLKINLDSEEEMTPDSREINLVDSFAKKKADYQPKDVITNQDEIIWFLKQILLNIHQRSKDSCSDCSYVRYLSKYCFEYIEQSQLITHVDFNDERFTNLATRLKDLQNRAGEESVKKAKSLGL